MGSSQPRSEAGRGQGEGCTFGILLASPFGVARAGTPASWCLLLRVFGKDCAACMENKGGSEPNDDDPMVG